MEDLFKIVYANLMSAATVLNVDEATDIQVNYINGKYVVESEEGDILIKTKRERAEKPIFYKFVMPIARDWPINWIIIHGNF